MPSLWLDRRVEAGHPNAADVEQRFDVAVVGAGITGLTAAVLLARAGKRVAVIEARYVGAGASGNTTGKVSLLQGSKLSRIAAKHGRDVLRAYATGNAEGRDWLLRHCDDHGLSYQREDAISYAQTPDGVGAAEAELTACIEAGLDADWVSASSMSDTPFPFHGGVRLRDQAQLDPVPVLSSLVIELESHGGVLLQGVRVTGVSGHGPLTLDLHPTHPNDAVAQPGSLHARQCILATGIPILDRGLFFARVQPKRSYCLAFDVPGGITRGMYLSVDSPTRSVRYAPTAGGDKLVVGGAGHVVGRAASPSRSIAELASWTSLHFPGAVQTHFWSAQDYSPIDELPFVGPLLPGGDTLYVATGFDKWGMTNGVAAALALTSRILGGRMDWAQIFAPWRRSQLSGITTAVQSNLEVGYHLAKGWVTSSLPGTPEPTEGTGVVTGAPWQLRAESVVDGDRRTPSPVCPHLGGLVTWNDADLAWECPLHGSRFAPDGTLLEGPATRDLSHSG